MPSETIGAIGGENLGQERQPLLYGGILGGIFFNWKVIYM